MFRSNSRLCRDLFVRRIIRTRQFLCHRKNGKSVLLYENIMVCIDRQKIASFSAQSFPNSSGILLNCRDSLTLSLRVLTIRRRHDECFSK